MSSDRTATRWDGAWRDQALDLHRRSIVLNAACMSSQALIQPGRDFAQRWHGQAAGTGDCDLPRARDGGVNVLWQAICGSRGENEDEIPRQGLELLDTLYTDLIDHCADDVERALSVDDVRRVVADGKVAILLGMQAGQFLGGSLRALRMFHRLGVQYMTMTHAFTNRLCDSSSGRRLHQGLSEIGREVVREMGRLGVIPDVSHATYQANEQIVEHARGPVIATHSNSSVLCSPGEELARMLGGTGASMAERNLSDEWIQRLADTGGCVCVNFAPALVSQAFSDDYPRIKELRPELSRHLDAFRVAHPDDVEGWRAEREAFLVDRGLCMAQLEDVADHVEHIVGVAGWDHVGIGTDWEGTGGFHPRHLEDVSKIPLLTAELLRRGHGEADLQKLLGENMLRVLSEARAVAG